MQLPLPLDRQPVLRDFRDRLLTTYGPQRDAQRHDPTSQFVKAMVSSCTYDAVSQAAFWKLSTALSWADLPDLAPEVIAAIIRNVTRPAEKAAQLVIATRIIRIYRGTVDLDFLADWPTDAAFSWLDRLPGVGPKIAAVVLNFSTLRKPVFVVDRHVLRVSKRLGLLPLVQILNAGFVCSRGSCRRIGMLTIFTSCIGSSRRTGRTRAVTSGPHVQAVRWQ